MSGKAISRLSILIFLLLFLIFSSSSILLAATDGGLGKSSTGTSNISITIPPRVRISNVTDLDLGTWSGSGDRSKSDNVCIYTNDSAGTYKVTATGSGENGAFTLSDSNSYVLPYSLRWNDQANATGGIDISPGVTVTGQTGACATSTTCSNCGNDNANFRVNITSGQFLGTYAGSYTGNISILVEPD